VVKERLWGWQHRHEGASPTITGEVLSGAVEPRHGSTGRADPASEESQTANYRNGLSHYELVSIPIGAARLAERISPLVLSRIASLTARLSYWRPLFKCPIAQRRKKRKA
jgi:hypothetical protein